MVLSVWIGGKRPQAEFDPLPVDDTFYKADALLTKPPQLDFDRYLCTNKFVNKFFSNQFKFSTIPLYHFSKPYCHFASLARNCSTTLTNIYHTYPNQQHC